MAYCFGPRGKLGHGAATEFMHNVPETSRSSDRFLDERHDAFEQRLAACEKACADSRDACAKLQDEQATAADRIGKLQDEQATAADRLGKQSTISLPAAPPLWQDRGEAVRAVIEQLRVELNEKFKNLTEQFGQQQRQFVELQNQMEQQVRLVEELQSRTQDSVPAQLQERVQRLEQEAPAGIQRVDTSAASNEEQQRMFVELNNRMQNLDEAVNILLKNVGPSDENVWVPDESGIPPAPDKPDEDEEGKHRGLATVDHMLKQMEYGLRESTWDAGFFLFLPVYGIGVSVHQFVLLFLTLVIQACFSGVCYINFTESDFNQDLVDAYVDFRVDIGHDNRYMNAVTQKSLIQRLCQRSDGLELVSSQLQNLQNIDAYLGDDDAGFWEKFFGGPLMCVLALSCWTLTVSAEFRKIEACAWAILAVPAGPSTHVTYSTVNESVHLDSISLGRRIFVVGICIVRVGMSGFLLVVGLMFLAYEASVSDLLLNTVALEFVLHLDELVFASLTPAACTIFLGRVQPLEFSSFFRLGGWELRLAREALCVGFCVAVIYAALVSNMMQYMRDVDEALCAGYTAFTFSRDIFYFTFVTRTSPTEDAHASDLTQMMRSQIRATITRENPNTPQSAPYQGYGSSTIPSQFSFIAEEMSTFGIDQLVDIYNPACDDMLTSTVPFDLIAYVLVLNKTVSHCHDWGQACWQDSSSLSVGPSTVARMFCPISCGCNDPLSHTYSALSRNGCPTRCTKIKSYADKQNLLKCQDWSLQELRIGGFWDSWVDRLQAMVYLLSDLQAPQDLRQMGCAAINNSRGGTFWTNYCYGSLTPEVVQIRPLALACPLACNCNGNITLQNFETKVRSCPGTCSGLMGFVR